MKITVNEENARKMKSWIDTRKGVAVWPSIDLSDPSFQMLSPVVDPLGNAYKKPSWKCSNTPTIITDPKDILVSVDKEHKRFHVAVRNGSNGFSLKVTDGGTRRIRSEVEKAGNGAYYVFDYSDYKNAVIMKPEGKSIPLSEWSK